MKMATIIPEKMLAPCGVNCIACHSHLKKKNPCLGCWAQEEDKSKHCRECKIRTCMMKKGIAYCFECSTFPCEIIARLDKSYRQRYQMSIVEDAKRLKEAGSKRYLLEEKKRWRCKACDGIISMHDQACSDCGKAAKK